MWAAAPGRAGPGGRRPARVPPAAAAALGWSPAVSPAGRRRAGPPGVARRPGPARSCRAAAGATG
ncbi:MAG TPA: hypothetical protein VFA10_20165 [Ktedonobacteraceae bacterium]|nr:hypothetical protein [Ktedonobacteraceae bacterium]